MRNTVHKGRLSFLIIGREGRFLGICKEFGFVEEASTADEVENKLINASILLLKTVEKHPELEPSLNVLPPFKYLLLYYLVVFFGTIARAYYDFVSYTTRSRGSLRYV